MRLRLILAALFALTGIVWFFQGTGWLRGSVMTGSMVWSYIGIACIVVGAVIAWRARPGRGRG
ncbi:MAG: hypothetical protein ACYDCI_06020 [Candidatus Limnocylindrales bacterium]